MDIRRFLADLKTRGVYRVAAFYLAGCWALLQVADVAFPLVGLPDWAISSLLMAAAIGFPIALCLAWLFDLTAAGIAETDAVAEDGSILLTPARVVEISVVATLALLVGYLYMERLSTTGRGLFGEGGSDVTNERPAIAVMPFANLSDDPSADYLADGVAEEILNLLSSLGELDVAARTSSFYYRGQDVDLREVGRKLSVSHVLEGSVRRAEGRVRVTAQLVDTDSGFRLWSEAFDRAYDDSFRIQDDVARQVVGNLELMLSERSQQILEDRPELDPDAYDFYLRGREYLRSSPGPEGLSNAITLFTRATSLDEGYANAWAGLCDAHLERYRRGFNPDDFAAGETTCGVALSLSGDAPAVFTALGNLYQVSGRLEEAENQFSQALHLDASNSAALLGMARNYKLDGRVGNAESTYLSAIQAHPNYWPAYMGLGGMLYSLGRFDEAIPYYEHVTSMVPDHAKAFNGLAATHYLLGNFDKAAEAFAHSLDLEPNALAYANSGSTLFFLGRYEEAIEMYQQAVGLSPDNFENWGALGDAYYSSEGNTHELAAPTYAKAVRLAMERLQINPLDAQTLALLAHYQARLTEREAALESLEKALELAPEDMYVHYNCALAYATLGEQANALAMLKKAVGLGYAPKLVGLDVGFSSLKGLQSFDQLIAPI
ncbi:MAG: tetratricopeptide repeat protein [Pseudomonadota bacterium]